MVVHPANNTGGPHVGRDRGGVIHQSGLRITFQPFTPDSEMECQPEEAEAILHHSRHKS